jgi:hypothetical protein
MVFMVCGFFNEVLDFIKIHNSGSYGRILSEKKSGKGRGRPLFSDVRLSLIARIRTGLDIYLLKIVNDVLKQVGIVPKYAGKLYIEPLK